MTTHRMKKAMPRPRRRTCGAAGGLCIITSRCSEAGGAPDSEPPAAGPLACMRVTRLAMRMEPYGRYRKLWRERAMFHSHLGGGSGGQLAQERVGRGARRTQVAAVALLLP